MDGVTISQMIDAAHSTAVDKGWWDQPRSFGDQIALMHSELSETLEAFREPKTIDGVHCDPMTLIYTNVDGVPKRIEDAEFDAPQTPHKTEGVAAEFADVLIRIFDTCGAYNIPLAEALERKLAYNKTRPYRHGGKAL